MTFEIGIVVDLAGKQSFFQNASTKGELPKLNCSSTSDVILNMIKFQHDIDHVNSCLIVGFRDSIEYASVENST